MVKTRSNQMKKKVQQYLDEDEDEHREEEQDQCLEEDPGEDVDESGDHETQPQAGPSDFLQTMEQSWLRIVNPSTMQVFWPVVCFHQVQQTWRQRR